MGNTKSKAAMQSDEVLEPASVDDLEDILANTKRISPLSTEYSLMSALRSKNEDVNEVYDRILLGGQSFAKNIKALQKEGVTHVLNCAQGISFMHCNTDAVYYANTGIEYMGIGANDTMGYPLDKHFDDTSLFMDGALNGNKKGKVLVHCIMGYSRSPTIVIAYLMTHKGMTAREATRYVRARRDVHPNFGFLKQLSELDAKISSGKGTKATSTTREPTAVQPKGTKL